MCKESSCICAKLPVNTRPHPMVKRASPVRAIGTCACPLEPDIRNRRVKRYLLEEVGDVGDCVSTNFQPQKSVDSYQNQQTVFVQLRARAHAMPKSCRRDRSVIGMGLPGANHQSTAPNTTEHFVTLGHLHASFAECDGAWFEASSRVECYLCETASHLQPRTTNASPQGPRPGWSPYRCLGRVQR